VSQQINLFNPAFIPPKEYVTGKSLAFLLAGVLSVVGAGAAWALHQAEQQESLLAAAQAEQKSVLASFEASTKAAAARVANPALAAQLDEARARRDFRDRVLAISERALQAHGEGFARYLRGLAAHGVPGLWLTGLSLDAGGTNFSLSGQAVRQELVPEYVRRLNGDKVFSGKSFAGIQLGQVAVERADAATTPGGARQQANAATGAVSPGLTSAKTPPLLSFQLLAVAAPSAVAAEAKN
jgi:hypothetical protein